MGNTYYIGWDVGAWHCDKNTKSKDCICVVSGQNPTGCSKRLCIRKQFTESKIIDFLNNILGEKKFDENDIIYMAIDAVLCWPQKFVNLLMNGSIDGDDGEIWKTEKAIDNPLLYRKTERIVGKKHKPLSVVQGQIGSQSTKAIFFLKKYGFKMDTNEPGVWKCGNITAIETYPALLTADPKHDDIIDAKLCANLARNFADDLKLKEKMRYPMEQEEIESAKQEGWIWIPQLPKENTTENSSCPTL